LTLIIRHFEKDFVKVSVAFREAPYASMHCNDFGYHKVAEEVKISPINVKNTKFLIFNF